MYSVFVSLLLLELCFMIQRAVRSQGQFQYDSYPIHVYLWFEYSFFWGGNVLFNYKNSSLSQKISFFHLY